MSPSKIFISLMLLLLAGSLVFIKSGLRVKAETSKIALEASLRSELAIGDYGYIARSISDLYKLSLFDCIEVKTDSAAQTIIKIYNSTNCTSPFRLLIGHKEKAVLKTLGNNRLIAEFAVFPDMHIVIILIVLCISISWLIALSYRLYLNKTILDSLLSDLARQVSHDIRSPLSALNMISFAPNEIPEEKRILIRNSIQRINDIANDLLSKGKQETFSTKKIFSTTPDQIKSIFFKQTYEQTLLPTLIDLIISEKRIQFRDKVGIQIETDISQAYGLFVNINHNDLSRVLSNLINNSVEAFPHNTGTVTVSIHKNGEKVSITVEDDGNGIPDEVLLKLGERGATYGKENSQSGSGLGVWHAKSTIESYHGNFQIVSKIGQGTTVFMTLPLSEPPPWFQPSLLLHSKQKIVVLDDDISIHGIWRRRLDISNKDKCDVEFLSFTSGLEFKKYYRKLNTEASEAGAILFLIDIELLNQKQNGLDIVEELDLTNRLNQNVIIVTSRFDEPHIHSRCIKNNIKLIPKNMAGFISIEIEQPTARYDCILIDDDLLNHMTWSMYAKEKNKSFKSFYNVSDFLNEAGLIDKETPIYIDSNLGPEIKGEIFALDVSKLGFTKIFISTGYDSTLLNISDCVTGVVGKDPFF